MKNEQEKPVSQSAIEYMTDRLPKNFGQVSKKLYRGSWPKSTEFLLDLGITEVVSLFSSSDSKEKGWITELQQMITGISIKHTIIDIQSNDDLWKATDHIFQSDGLIYVHCQAGANRTSIVCLLSEIMRLGPELASKMTPMLINDAINYGFDYHKEKYRQILCDVLTQAQNKGLLFYWLLP